MNKRISSLVLIFIMLICLIPINSFAQDNHKTIVINMNRSNFSDFMEIPTIKNELDKRGYMALMNVRGDQGTDDKRGYASIGAGGRVNTFSSDFDEFRNANEDTKQMYESVTGKKAEEINDLAINKSINDNIEKGQYGSILGSLGQALNDNKLSVSVLGNADTGLEPELFNRNIAAMAMDKEGRVDKGNVDDINIVDSKMPFGIRTDYEKLKKETKIYYDESDVVFIELGDTYRLDLYKEYLNEDTYNKMEKNIQKKIDSYMNEVLNILQENDKLYIISAFPKDIDYKNKRRLAPVIKFDGEGKGTLKSSTTRREGIIGNVDIGVDILNDFNISSDVMVGRSFEKIQRDDNKEFIKDEYSRIVSIGTVRGNIISTFINFVSAILIMGVLLLGLKNKIVQDRIIKGKITKDKNIAIIVKELLKFGLIMPLAFLIAPIFKLNTQFGIYASIIISGIAIYLIVRLIFKNDDKRQIGLIAIMSITIIISDTLFGSYLMKNSIMSYDAIVGARYYGIGNEYQGIIIGSSIMGMALLLQNKKLPKIIVPILSIIILFISASPTMGANVGSAISESVAFIIFIMLIFNIKLDWKKLLIALVGAGVVVLAFALIDMLTGSKSHLSLFITRIFADGPSAIIEVFSRKISMNLKLLRTSAWVSIIALGIISVGLIRLIHKNTFKNIINNNKYLTKGLLGITAGAFITLLVNDSGVVSSATTILYISIPFVIIAINEINTKGK